MTAEPRALAAPPIDHPAPVGALTVFVALLGRDLHVTRRDMVAFLLRNTLQPALFTIVFGYLLPRMGFVGKDYAAALLPGILGMSLALASLQAVALPMVVEFVTKEVEDRLLAPARVEVVAFEKMFSGVLQGLASVVFTLIIARPIMGPVASLAPAHLLPVLAIATLGAATFSAFGLWLGTALDPQKVSLMFSVIIAPMLFFGCAYYPWAGLRAVPVMQWAVLINPLVYVSEGLRGTLTPAVPHMPLLPVLLALVVLTGLFAALGLRTFDRRSTS